MADEDGEILEWAGGEHRFFLRVGEIRALQSKTDCGPMYLFNKFQTGTWLIDDLFETIRLGLIGGGTEKAEVTKLMNLHVVGSGNYLSLIPLASQIIQVSLVKPKEDDDDSEVDDETEGKMTTMPDFREEK